VAYNQFGAVEILDLNPSASKQVRKYVMGIETEAFIDESFSGMMGHSR